MSRVALLLTAVLALAACAGGTGSPDVAGEWEFAEGTAEGADLPRPQGARATLEVDAQELRGVAFCNHYSSAYRLTGSSFSVDELARTEMGCEPALMAAESAYLAALGTVDTAAVDGDVLMLTGGGVELRFTPAPRLPDSPLEGTRWVLETVVDGETASSTIGAPTLLLDADRRATATTGCGALTGTWSVEAGALVVDDVLADSSACPADLERQDAHVTAVLQGRPAVEIEQDQLTLTADNGRGLVYRAG